MSKTLIDRVEKPIGSLEMHDWQCQSENNMEILMLVERLIEHGQMLQGNAKHIGSKCLQNSIVSCQVVPVLYIVDMQSYSMQNH
jgi:hypothetical protein